MSMLPEHFLPHMSPTFNDFHFPRTCCAAVTWLNGRGQVDVICCGCIPSPCQPVWSAWQLAPPLILAPCHVLLTETASQPAPVSCWGCWRGRGSSGVGWYQSSHPVPTAHPPTNPLQRPAAPTSKHAVFISLSCSMCAWNIIISYEFGNERDLFRGNGAFVILEIIHKQSSTVWNLVKYVVILVRKTLSVAYVTVTVPKSGTMGWSLMRAWGYKCVEYVVFWLVSNFFPRFSAFESVLFHV